MGLNLWSECSGAHGPKADVLKSDIQDLLNSQTLHSQKAESATTEVAYKD